MRVRRVAPRRIFSVRVAAIVVGAQAEVRVVGRRACVRVRLLVRPLLALGMGVEGPMLGPRPKEGPLVVVHLCVGLFADIVPAVPGVAIDICCILCANENAFRERLSVYGVVY